MEERVRERSLHKLMKEDWSAGLKLGYDRGWESIEEEWEEEAWGRRRERRD